MVLGVLFFFWKGKSCSLQLHYLLGEYILSLPLIPLPIKRASFQVCLNLNQVMALTIILVLGGLDLAIEGPSKAEISCIDNKDGTCTVTYLPTLPGDYSIIVKYNDKHIPGSPFTAKITGMKDTV